MKEFLTLLSEILIIAVLQQISEKVVDPKERPDFAKLISLACYAGSFSLIIHFVFTYVLKDIITALESVF
ncbi:MAG: hypothetical protein LBS21_11225 [Clostridiales bacterium]|jgi:hypothetical protein|nr:hypothetical protein [Clostridiales bacterium]